MGIEDRKRREKSLRKKRIQAAAKEIFLRKGFNAATVEEIAYKAELSPATIYSYFKSKEELFASLMLIPSKYLAQQIKKIYQNNALSVEEKIMASKDAMLKTFRYDQLMLRNIFHFQVEDTFWGISEELLKEINDIVGGFMKMIAKVCEEGARQERFTDGNGMAFADIIWGTFAGLVMWEEAKRKIDPRKDFLEPTLDMAFNLLLKGMKRQP